MDSVTRRATGRSAGRLTIRNLAKRLELNPRTIRFYEQAGVLPHPERSESGYRLYGDEDEARLRFVKSAEQLGLTLGKIKEVLASRDRGSRSHPVVHTRATTRPDRRTHPRIRSRRSLRPS